MNHLATAIAITSTIFKDKKDKAGKPYILHCLRVMHAVDQNDEELMSIAIMHDLVEDSNGVYTVQILRELGFSERVCEAVKLLTHDPLMPYDEYIKLIATNKDATKVKLADLIDNSNITRLKGLRKKDFERMEKYHRSFVYLSE